MEEGDPSRRHDSPCGGTESEEERCLMDMFFSLCCQWGEAREVPLSPSMRRSTGELDLAPPPFPSLGPTRGEWPGARRASGGVRSWEWRRGCRGGASVGSQAYVVALLQVPHRSWLTKGRRIWWFNLDIICAYFQQELLIINENGQNVLCDWDFVLSRVCRQEKQAGNGTNQGDVEPIDLVPNPNLNPGGTQAQGQG